MKQIYVKLSEEQLGRLKAEGKLGEEYKFDVVKIPGFNGYSGAELDFSALAKMQKCHLSELGEAELIVMEGEFKKRNPSEIIDLIEAKVSRELRRKGFPVIEAKPGENSLEIPYSGKTLYDLISGNKLAKEEEKTKLREHLKEANKLRLRINQALEKILNEEEKLFLKSHQYQKVQDSFRKKGVETNLKEIEENFFAYKIMSAIGKYDKKFKEVYGQAFSPGQVSDLMLWTADSNAKNFLVKEGQIFKIDFNNIRYRFFLIDDITLAESFGNNFLFGREAYKALQPENDLFYLRESFPRLRSDYLESAKEEFLWRARNFWHSHQAYQQIESLEKNCGERDQPMLSRKIEEIKYHLRIAGETIRWHGCYFCSEEEYVYNFQIAPGLERLKQLEPRGD